MAPVLVGLALIAGGNVGRAGKGLWPTSKQQSCARRTRPDTMAKGWRKLGRSSATIWRWLLPAKSRCSALEAWRMIEPAGHSMKERMKSWTSPQEPNNSTPHAAT